MNMDEPMKLALERNGAVDYHIVLIGTGGTGGYVLRSLVRMIYTYRSVTGDRYHLTICDGDTVEEKNLLRQDFIEADLYKKKVDVLAERFGYAYGLSITKRDQYVESLKDMDSLCGTLPMEFWGNEYRPVWTILVACVDNNASRQLFHQYFHQVDNLVYIDAGNTSVILPEKPREEWTEEEKELAEESGYSGQVVLGWRRNGKTLLPPVGFVFPDILEDKETFFPSQSCGREVVNHPQRRMTNEVAAMIVTSYLNNLFGQREIVSHMTTFNAQTMVIKPWLITKEYLSHLAQKGGIGYSFTSKD